MSPAVLRRTNKQTFVLRIWLEDLGDGKQEWRAGIYHLASRETQYFRDWKQLITFVSARFRNSRNVLHGQEP